MDNEDYTNIRQKSDLFCIYFICKL